MIRVYVADCKCLITFRLANVTGSNIIFEAELESKRWFKYSCDSHEDAINKLKQITIDGYFFAEHLEFFAAEEIE